MLRRLLVTTVLLFIATICIGCGFTAIYGKTTYGRSEKASEPITKLLDGELSKIAIQKGKDQLSQKLRNALYDLFVQKPDPSYFMSLKVSVSVVPTYITGAGSSGRNRVTLIASYELKRLSDGKLIGKNSTSVYDNYSVSDIRYANYTSEEAIGMQLCELAALNIRDMAVSDLVQFNKEESYADVTK